MTRFGTLAMLRGAKQALWRVWWITGETRRTIQAAMTQRPVSLGIPISVARVNSRLEILFWHPTPCASDQYPLSPATSVSHANHGMFDECSGLTLYRFPCQ